jgi:hypothetical protein
MPYAPIPPPTTSRPHRKRHPEAAQVQRATGHGADGGGGEHAGTGHRRDRSASTAPRSRIRGVDVDLGERRGDRPPRQRVHQLLLEAVADHSLRLRGEDIERVRCEVAIRLCLQREQADLWSVSVGDHDVGVLSEPATGRTAVTMLALRLGLAPLAAADQRVAAECYDHPVRAHPPDD